ncbi:OsmC family protein [Streptomyces sp. NPDC046994]|uniref:OsmC family protein n=1 Tax=unclassified Streptomyces TaxID=2593676 RepID=UPI0033C7438C
MLPAPTPAPPPFSCSWPAGACTSMTVRLYAERKGWPLAGIKVDVRTAHGIRPFGQILKDVEIIGDLNAEQISRLATIAGRCPIQCMLNASAPVYTRTASRRPWALPESPALAGAPARIGSGHLPLGDPAGPREG